MEKNRGNNKILTIIVTVVMTVLLMITFYNVFKNPSSQRIFKDSMNNVVEIKAKLNSESVSFGTAVLFNNDGYFITNAHIVTFIQAGEVRKFDRYYIRFSFENIFRSVELISFDRVLDLAIVKFDELPSFRLRSVSLGSSNNLRTGDNVYAIGNAQNFGIGMTKGIISQPLVNIEYNGIIRSVIQSNIIITNGNSGGALLNARGRLIGITTFRTRDGSGNVIHGIAYSIPINIVKEFITQ